MMRLGDGENLICLYVEGWMGRTYEDVAELFLGCCGHGGGEGDQGAEEDGDGACDGRHDWISGI